MKQSVSPHETKCFKHLKLFETLWCLFSSRHIRLPCGEYFA